MTETLAPRIAALFEAAGSDRGEQPKRLAATILAYAQNVDRLEVLGPAIEAIARRHVTTGVERSITSRPRRRYRLLARVSVGRERTMRGGAV